MSEVGSKSPSEAPAEVEEKPFWARVKEAFLIMVLVFFGIFLLISFLFSWG